MVWVRVRVQKNSGLGLRRHSVNGIWNTYPINQTTESFQEMSYLITYKSKLIKTNIDRCILSVDSDGPHMTSLASQSHPR